MPLPDPLARLVSTRRFWTDAYFQTYVDDPIEGLADARVRFAVSDDQALVLRLDEYLSYCSLELVAGDAPPFEIAWDDQAHWHPHVLRWSELDAIGRAIASRDPSLPHPGIPLLLLARFAPVVGEEDGAFAMSLLRAACEAVDELEPGDASLVFDHIDARGADFRWVETARGHVLEQPDTSRGLRRALYTLRHAEHAAFPLEALEALAPEAAPSPTPQVALPTPVVWIELELQHRGLPAAAGHFLGMYLDTALQDAGLGSAEADGEMSSATGETIATFISASMRTDQDTAATRLADLLAAAGVLDRIRAWDVELLPSRPATRYVQLHTLEIARWKGAQAGWRYDRPGLDEGQRAALGEALDELGFGTPDETGRRTRPDGVAACFGDLGSSEALDGGSIWLPEVTDASAAVVLELMQAGSLFAYPPLIAPTAAHAETLDGGWPEVTVASSAAALAQRLRGED